MSRENDINSIKRTDTGFVLRSQPKDWTEEEELRNKFAGTASSKQTINRKDWIEAGELPQRYNRNCVFLTAREPRLLFCYWDIPIDQHRGGPLHLRCIKSSGVLECETVVILEAPNWYIPVSDPGQTYHVELGYYSESKWHLVAASQPATTPVEQLTEDLSFHFATLSPKESFDELLRQLKGASREQLLEILARLQQGDLRTLPDSTLLDADWIKLLRSFLGIDLLQELLSNALSSEVLSSRIQQQLSEILGSEIASSFFQQVEQFSTESSLASYFGGLSSFSESSLASWSQALMSWGAAARSALASEWLSSFASGAAFGSWDTTSWETGSFSWTKAIELSSWWQSSVSSWIFSGISSWFTESVSSWSTVDTSSWSSPTSGFGREFFMHVNAEVIFYGGTHPDAKVTIGGQPIQLTPEGTFHYHQLFSEGQRTIPIIAISPDGVEERSAVLTFSRDTQKHGHVTDSPQPPLSPL